MPLRLCHSAPRTLHAVLAKVRLWSSLLITPAPAVLENYAVLSPFVVALRWPAVSTSAKKYRFRQTPHAKGLSALRKSLSYGGPRSSARKQTVGGGVSRGLSFLSMANRRKTAARAWREREKAERVACSTMGESTALDRYARIARNHDVHRASPGLAEAGGAGAVMKDEATKAATAVASGVRALSL